MIFIYTAYCKMLAGGPWGFLVVVIHLLLTLHFPNYSNQHLCGIHTCTPNHYHQFNFFSSVAMSCTSSDQVLLSLPGWGS